MQQTVSERFKIVRKHFDLTQSSFADSLEIKQSSVSTIEQGGNPDIETIKKIAIAYKIDLNWLILGEGARPVFRAGNISTEVDSEWKDKYDKIELELAQINKELLVIYRRNQALEDENKKLKGI